MSNTRISLCSLLCVSVFVVVFCNCFDDGGKLEYSSYVCCKCTSLVPMCNVQETGALSMRIARKVSNGTLYSSVYRFLLVYLYLQR